MSKYLGEVSFELDGVEIYARATWAVFERVYDNTKLGPVEIHDRCLSRRWGVNEMGYMLYFGIKAAPEQPNTSASSIKDLDYKTLTTKLQGLNKIELADVCAEMCQLFILGVNSMDEVEEPQVIEPEDTDGEKKN